MLSIILGWTATILFSAMMIPQLIKTLRTKKVDDISSLMWLISAIANVIAFGYALTIMQPQLLVKYSFAFCLSIIYLIVYCWYKSGTEQNKA